MIDFDHIQCVADITRHQAKVMPKGVAQVFEGRETSFGELDARSNQVAQALIAEGCKPDARIAFMGKGSDRYFEMLHGAIKAGSVVVGVNWRLAPPEVAYVLNDSQTEIVFVGAEFVDIVAQVLSDCPSVRKVVALDGGYGSWQSFDDWRDARTPEDPQLKRSGDDDVIQLYTSGTTGHPKGVQLTNDNYISVLRQATEAGWGNWDAGDANLVCMPLFHVAGVNVGIIGNAHGCKNIILKDVDPSAIFGLIRDYQINIAFMVPAVIMMLLQHPESEGFDFSSLKQVIYGASPIAEDVLRQAQVKFRCDFVQVYGLTETTGAGTYLPPEAHDPARNKLRSCGLPNPGMEIAVVDDEGRSLPQGEVGEIMIRGGGIMKAYWNRPDATAEAIDDKGWFKTGDAGYFDEEGFLYIHDRVKDMIVTGGENVYPAEVENALFGHPAVADVAVIGVPDDKWGEAVKGIIVCKPGEELDPADMIAWAKTQIAGYKVPKTIDFLDVLPRNPSGKILRRELRDPYWEGLDRKVN